MMMIRSATSSMRRGLTSNMGVRAYGQKRLNSNSYITPIDAKKCEEDPKNYSVITLDHYFKTNIRYQQETKMEFFKQTLLNATNDSINDVKFYTITGAQIPLCETVEDLNDFPILCYINNTHMYAFNFSFETSIAEKDNTIHDEMHYFEFASGIGLKEYQRYFYAQLAHKYISALPEDKPITREELNNSMTQVLHHYKMKEYNHKYAHPNRSL